MRNLPLSISILANSLIPGSRRYEMLSSRAYRLSHKWQWECVRVLIDAWFAVMFREMDHCRNCYETQSKELGHLWSVKES